MGQWVAACTPGSLFVGMDMRMAGWWVGVYKVGEVIKEACLWINQLRVQVIESSLC